VCAVFVEDYAVDSGNAYGAKLKMGYYVAVWYCRKGEQGNFLRPMA
jgi:hypothetical protein